MHVRAWRVGWGVRRVFGGALALGLLVPKVALAPPGTLFAQPRNYVSPSGTYSLFVDPSEQFGHSAAFYRFSKNGEEVWSGDRPYTLREAVVTDDGLATGFAYRVDKEAVLPEDERRTVGDSCDPPEYLHIVILEASGHELLNEVTERMEAPWLSTPPTAPRPEVVQFIADPENDRIIVRVRARGEVWWVYRLSSGTRIDEVSVAKRMQVSDRMRYILEARTVPGTPLTLVHWYFKDPDYQVKEAGGRFVLVDDGYKPIWTFDLAKDYVDVDMGSAYMGGGPADYFERHPAILSTKRPGRFGLRCFAENKEVPFVARRAADGYDVTELGRINLPDESPHVWSGAAQPEAELTYLGEVKLASDAAAESPFRNIRDVTFDITGHMYFLRSQGKDTAELVTVDQNGTLLSERRLEDGAQEGFHRQWTEVSFHTDGCYYLMKKGADEEYSAWLVDLATGEQVPFEHCPTGFAKSLSRFSDGGFVMLDNYSRTSRPSDRIRCFDSQGNLQWQMRSDNMADREILGTGTKGLAVTTDQRVVLLTGDALQVLDRNGDHVKKISLIGAFGDTEFGGRPGYLHEVVADADGGFLVANHRNPPVVLRYDSDGSLRSRWSPRHADGQTFSLKGGICVAPDGRLWTSDGRSIMRLTDDGVVDSLLGEPLEDDRLEKIVGFTADRQGRLYAVAYGTGAVHVFDSSGHLLHICKPQPGDFAGTVKRSTVAVTDQGEVHVKRPPTTNYRAPDEYLRFSATGERLGPVTFEPRLGGLGDVIGWCFQPGTGYRCGFRGFSELVIADQAGTIIHEIKKRPNEKWFSFLRGLATAPDGSIAVLQTDPDAGSRVYEVDLFSATGEPIRTLRLPPAAKHFGGLAYDGTQIIVAGNEEILRIDPATGHVDRWSLGETVIERGSWAAYLLPGGRELLLSCPQGPVLHRYQLPAVREGARASAEDGAVDQGTVDFSPWPDAPVVADFENVLSSLPEPAPCTVYIRKIANGEAMLPESEAMTYSEEERSEMRTTFPGECAPRFDAPQVYSRPLAILAGAGMHQVEGAAILDVGCCDLQAMRALAKMGGNVVGAQAGFSMMSMCPEWNDQGSMAGDSGRQGHLELVHVCWPDSAGLADRGEEYDAVILRNAITKPDTNDYFSPQPWTNAALGDDQQEVARNLHDLVKPGGYVLVFNISTPPALPENPLPQKIWGAAGFQVIRYDQADDDAVRELGRQLGWDAQVPDLEANLHARYTLLQRPDES